MTSSAEKNSNGRDDGSASEGLICCAMCRHFSYFENKAGHNSPHALGRCAVESWDGNQGQWAMFQHQCRNFAEALSSPMP